MASPTSEELLVAPPTVSEELLVAPPTVAPRTLEELLKKVKITKISKQQVSDEHLRVIAQSHCKDWKKLPSLLGLETIVADDIGRSGKEEEGKRHDFLMKWKSLKGSGATYKQLIAALLKIRCVNDAEKVCELLKKSVPAAAPSASPSATPKSLTGSGATANPVVAQCGNISCEWKGHVDLLEEHMRNECSNREYECPHKHCNEKGTYASITQVHDGKCKKKPLPCTNSECTTTIQRQCLKRHLETCPHTEFPCKYRALGCPAKMKRSEITAHEKDEKPHLNIALLDKISSMEKEIAALKKDKKEHEGKQAPAAPKRQQSSSSGRKDSL